MLTVDRRGETARVVAVLGEVALGADEQHVGERTYELALGSTVTKGC